MPRIGNDYPENPKILEILILTIPLLAEVYRNGRDAAEPKAVPLE